MRASLHAFGPFGPSSRNALGARVLKSGVLTHRGMCSMGPVTGQLGTPGARRRASRFVLHSGGRRIREDQTGKIGGEGGGGSHPHGIAATAVRAPPCRRAAYAGPTASQPLFHLHSLPPFLLFIRLFFSAARVECQAGTLQPGHMEPAGSASPRPALALRSAAPELAATPRATLAERRGAADPDVPSHGHVIRRYRS